MSFWQYVWLIYIVLSASHIAYNAGQMRGVDRCVESVKRVLAERTGR